jgi:hypothetical protein
MREIQAILKQRFFAELQTDVDQRTLLDHIVLKIKFKTPEEIL